MTDIQYQSTSSPLVPVSSGRIGFLPAFGRAAMAVVELLYTWQDRVRQRSHLASLDDHLLKDLGIARADATRESAKPFWRA